jgi:hypothetical protein
VGVKVIVGVMVFVGFMVEVAAGTGVDVVEGITVAVMVGRMGVNVGIACAGEQAVSRVNENSMGINRD